MYLNYIKEKRKSTLTSKCFLNWRSVYIRTVLRQGCGIVLNIGVLEAGMKQRTCGNSIQIEYNGAEVHIRELLYSVHPEIFKARCIVGVQNISIYVWTL